MTINQTTVTTTIMEWPSIVKSLVSLEHCETRKSIEFSIGDGQENSATLDISVSELNNLIEQMIDFRDTIKGIVKMSEEEFMGDFDEKGDQ